MAAPGICGGWSGVEEMTDKHQEMVKFAFDQITMEGSEHKHATFKPVQIVDVLEMTTQVVSGMNYKFHLVLADKNLTEEEKKDETVPKKKVKITVYDQPWTNTRQISKLEWVE